MVRVAASDGSAAATGDFVLTVADVDDPPVLVLPIADQSATQDAPFVFRLPAGTFVDPDGEPLAYG